MPTTAIHQLTTIYQVIHWTNGSPQSLGIRTTQTEAHALGRRHHTRTGRPWQTITYQIRTNQ